MAFVVTVAAGEASVGLGLGLDGFVGSGFRGSFVGEGSTSTLATTLASGVGVSAICVPPQPASTNMNAAVSRNGRMNFRSIEVSPVIPNPPWDS